MKVGPPRNLPPDGRAESSLSPFTFLCLISRRQKSYAEFQKFFTKKKSKKIRQGIQTLNPLRGLALARGGEEVSSPGSQNKTGLSPLHVRQSQGQLWIMGCPLLPAPYRSATLGRKDALRHRPPQLLGFPRYIMGFPPLGIWEERDA